MYGQMVTITIMSPKFTTGKSSNASICFTFLHGGGRGEVGKGWVEGVGGLGGGRGGLLYHTSDASMTLPYYITAYKQSNTFVKFSFKPVTMSHIRKPRQVCFG